MISLRSRMYQISVDNVFNFDYNCIVVDYNNIMNVIKSKTRKIQFVQQVTKTIQKRNPQKEFFLK